MAKRKQSSRGQLSFDDFIPHQEEFFHPNRMNWEIVIRETCEKSIQSLRLKLEKARAAGDTKTVSETEKAIASFVSTLFSMANNTGGG